MCLHASMSNTWWKERISNVLWHLISTTWHFVRVGIRMLITETGIVGDNAEKITSNSLWVISLPLTLIDARLLEYSWKYHEKCENHTNELQYTHRAHTPILRCYLQCVQRTRYQYFPSNVSSSLLTPIDNAPYGRLCKLQLHTTKQCIESFLTKGTILFKHALDTSRRDPHNKEHDVTDPIDHDHFKTRLTNHSSEMHPAISKYDNASYRSTAQEVDSSASAKRLAAKPVQADFVCNFQTPRCWLKGVESACLMNNLTNKWQPYNQDVRTNNSRMSTKKPQTERVDQSVYTVNRLQAPSTHYTERNFEVPTNDAFCSTWYIRLKSDRDF